jgi:uncharacterized membrane protein YgcG
VLAIGCIVILIAADLTVIAGNPSADGNRSVGSGSDRGGFSGGGGGFNGGSARE